MIIKKIAYTDERPTLILYYTKEEVNADMIAIFKGYVSMLCRLSQ